MDSLQSRQSAILGTLGGRRGRLIEHVTSHGSSRPRAASVGSVSSAGSISAGSASSAGSSQRRFSVTGITGGVRGSRASDKGPSREIDSNFVKELASQLRWRNRNLLALTQTFLPSLVSEALLRTVVTRTDLELPLLQERSGCCLKVNCSGFVELTARLEQKVNGAAMLSKCINRFYTHVIDIVVAYRGDIVRFNANTMIVFFEAVEDTYTHHNACGSRCCEHTPQELACIRAAACCFELHKHLHHVDVGEGGGHLTLQIGVGAGSMRVLVVQGSPSTESVAQNKYTVSGSPLDQASLAETLAGACETVFSPQAWQHVANTVREGETVTQQPDFHRFVGFDTRRHTYPMVRHAALQSAATDTALLGSHPRSGTVRRCLGVLMNFLPDSVLRHLWAGTLSNVNELRTLSIAFVYVKGLDLGMADGAQTVAVVIAELQRAAFAEEGFLHRFLLDDQGLLLQFAFGMPPLVHTDDPLRACRACAKMMRITARHHLTGHAGVATGKVFCGLVGSDRRHEYGIVGSAVQLAINLSGAADASVVLADSVTHQSCESELDFEAVQVELAESPAEAFRMLALRAEREMRMTGSPGQSRHGSKLGWPAELSVLEDQANIDLTPCTPPMSHPPPWLANLREETLAVQWEQPIPTLWTHVCAERPPPPLPSVKEGEDAGDGLQYPSHGGPSPWRTYVKVPLPWPARSTACGGVSPLPHLRTWGHLLEAERLADVCAEKGGDMLVLAGPYGCGKTELTEHLTTRATKGPLRMQPIFGAMEVRTGQRWAAISGVVRSALALLQPAGRIHSSREFAELLRKEVTSQWEERTLVMSGLLDPTCDMASNKSGQSTESDQLSAGGVDHGTFPSDEDIMPLVDLTLRLIKRLLTTGSIVVALRISQGTSLLGVQTNGFWLLARSLGSLAQEHSATVGRKTSLLVLLTCRDVHIPLDMDPKHPILHIGPLTGQEVQRYIHLCLGLNELNEDAGDPQAHTLRAAACLSDLPSEPGQAEEDAAGQDSGLLVPEVLLQWLRRIASLPRHLEEGLTQLRHAGVIAISGGRCVVNADMELLDTADWIHTHMVGRIISQMEVMVPEMQHVLQIATVLPGPFSSLDLAAAIRVHLAWDTPNMMALYHCVKHLIACGELVRAGFMRRIDIKGSNSLGDGDNYIEPEEASCMPRWIVTSFLIQQVVSSTVLQGMRMQLKRAILLSRATESLRQTRRSTWNRSMHRPSDASFSSEAARSAKMLGNRPKIQRSVQKPGAPTDVNISNTRYLGLPSSCIITSTTLHRVEHMASQNSSGADSEEISFEMPQRHELSKNQPKSFVQTLPCARRLPWKLVHQCFILTILVVVLLYPDLWVILEGSPGSLDAVMLLAMCLFAMEMVHCLTYDRNYTYRSLFTDLVLLVCILLDVSWAMGKPYTDLALQRRDPGSVWRIIGVYIKFGACAVRLTFYIRSMAGLLQNGYAEVKSRRSQLSPDMVMNSPEDTKMLETISKRLSQAILSHLVGFTILMIVSVQVVDLFTPPKEDASMQSWVQLLSHEASINSSVAAPTLQGELHRFKEFYGDMAYGPYHICLGATQSEANFTCQHMLWQSRAGSDFTDPRRQSFQLDFNSATVKASFDFSGPAKHEALIRMMIISTTVFCMVFVALSLDSVANGLIVVPLARLMPTVRSVVEQLKEMFPSLVEHEPNGEETDEVAAFEEIVSKITLIVTVANKNTIDNQDTQMGAEWISGLASQKGTPTSTLRMRPSRILTHITSDVPMNDVRRLQNLGVSYELLDSWDYDVLAQDKPQLTGVAGWLLLDCANPYLALQPQVVAAFLDAMVVEYRDENPYHNWRHACDVLHGVFRGCSMNRVLEFASRVDVFALLVAAVSHDAGHPGWNNIFLVQTSHELALRYNDNSPLENMHCSTMFGVLSSRPDANVFGVLSKEQYREARQICIETILHTDNAKHFEMVKELQMFYHTNSDVFEQRGSSFLKPAEVDLLQQVKNRRITMAALLHGADISNPCKPWSICESWADHVLSEFFAQGDKEKELGIPVQMLNNRDTVNKPGSQVAFIQFFIYPFNTALVKIFAPLWEMSENLCTNLQKWQAMRAAEEQEKTGPTIQGICEDLQSVINTAQKETRQASKATNPESPTSKPDAAHRLAKSNTWATEVRTYSPVRGPAKLKTSVEDLSGGSPGHTKMTRQCSSQSFVSDHSKSPRPSPREVPLPNAVSGDEAPS